MKKVIVAAALLLSLAACETDPATMLAGGLKANCKHSNQCGTRPDFPAEGPKTISGRGFPTGN
jgi:hypothetical protein